MTLGAATFWGLAAYGAMTCWFLGRGVLFATWGAPDPGIVLLGGLAVAAHAAVGFLAGRIVPGRFTPLLAAVVTYGVLIATTMIESFAGVGTIRLVSPLGIGEFNEPNVWFARPEIYVDESLLWVAGALGALWMLAALLRSRHFGWWIGLAASGIVAVTGLVPLLHAVTPTTPGSERIGDELPLMTSVAYEPACTTGPVVEVCVHPAYAARLDDTGERLNRFLAPVAGLPGVPETIAQSDPAAVGDAPRWNEFHGFGDGSIAFAVVESVFPPEGRDGRSDAQQVIFRGLVEQSGIDCPFPTDDPAIEAATERFAALSPDEQRAWLELNWDALRAGDLNPGGSSMSVSSSPLLSSPIGTHRFDEAPGPGDAVRSMLTLFWIEIRRSQGFWLLPLMVGLGLFLNWGQTEINGGVVLWPDLSRSTMQSYVIVGPLGAGLAAWLVDRDRRRRIQGLVGTMATSPFRRDLVLLTAASFWGLAGYALIAAWYGVQGVLEATWGGPDLPLIATGALGIAVLAGFGFITGRLVRGKFSPIVAVASAFFLAAAPEFIQTWINPPSGMQTSLPFRRLTPWGLVAERGPSIYYRFPSGYLVAALVWLAAVAAITIVVISLMRSWRRNWTAWVAMVVFGAVAVLGADRVIHHGTGLMLEDDLRVPFTYACTTTGVAEVCVHPAYEATLAESARRLDEVMTPIAGLPGVPTRWEQGAPYGERGPDVADFYPGNQYVFAHEIGQAVFPPSSEGHFYFTAAQIVILNWLSSRVNSGGPGDGFFDYPAELMSTPVTDEDGMMTGFNIDPDAEAHFLREIPAATDRFAALGPEEQRAWLEANWDALRAGELTLEDLP